MRIEPRVQQGGGIPYREVMAETMAGVADELGLVVPEGEADALADRCRRGVCSPRCHRR